MFVVTAFLALLMASGVAVVGLTELTGSLTLAMLIVGVVYAIVATLIYLRSLRRRLQQWQHRLDIIYEVSAMFDTLYRHATAFLERLTVPLKKG